jgi:hypothetical protein
MNSFRLIACPSISHERRTDRYFESGQTVGDYLRKLGWTTEGLNARVFIDGRLVPEAEWLDAKPAAGQAVVVRRVLQGGGGQGNGGKQVAMLVGMLAILAAAFAAPAALASLASLAGASGGVWGGIIGSSGLITGVVSVGGMLALHGRIPKPLPRRVPIPMRTLPEAA